MREGELLNVHKDLIILLEAGPMEYTIPGMENLPLKEGVNGVLGLQHSPPTIYLLSIVTLTNMYGMHNKVEFLKFPATPQGQVGTFPPSPSIFLEDVIAHIEAFSK